MVCLLTAWDKTNIFPLDTLNYSFDLPTLEPEKNLISELKNLSHIEFSLFRRVRQDFRQRKKSSALKLLLHQSMSETHLTEKKSFMPQLRIPLKKRHPGRNSWIANASYCLRDHCLCLHSQKNKYLFLNIDNTHTWY